MDRAQVFEILQSQIATVLELAPEDITEESLLAADFDADSLDLLELILSLKERFGIAVNDGEVKELLTELARFLPDPSLQRRDLDDGELAEVTRKLRVSTIVDFVLDRTSAARS